ncbi:MAG: 50S ribosomal protein L10 [Chromatiales bacterium]|nr:50S ribosomal protein L10 [Chromatiales bacterium]
MALSLEQKKAIVAEVAEVASTAHSAVAAEYRGLSVEQLTQLRVQARGAGVYLRVVKNNLAKRAVEGTEFACMQESMVGPLIIGFSQQDPGAAARVMGDFAKTNDKLKITMAAIGGKLLGPEAVPSMAKLPTRDEAIAQLMAVIKAPLDKFARTLNEPVAKLARTLAAVRDQKEAA